MRVFAFALILAIGACVGNANLTPKQAVYALGAQYASLGEAALVYMHQPLCTEAAIQPLCAEIKVVRAIQKADAIFWVSLTSAQAMVNSADSGKYLAASVDALQVMRTILVKHAIKGAIQ